MYKKNNVVNTKCDGGTINMLKKNKRELGEDTTKYGEFVCSLDHWLPIEKQKEKAEKLENITIADNKNIRKKEI